MTLHKGYMSNAHVSPDYLLGEVTRPGESQLSETLALAEHCFHRPFSQVE